VSYCKVAILDALYPLAPTSNENGMKAVRGKTSLLTSPARVKGPSRVRCLTKFKKRPRTKAGRAAAFFIGVRAASEKVEPSSSGDDDDSSDGARL
jgi:hypothetical protein